LKHEFLGTDRVIQYLSQLAGYDDGLVELQQGPDGCVMMRMREVNNSNMNYQKQ
jgi:hypothetical protein